MEDAVVSRDNAKPAIEELKNGLVELANGDHEGLNLVICNEHTESITFDELSNSNSNNEFEQHDPLSNGTSNSNEATDLTLAIEPTVLTEEINPLEENTLAQEINLFEENTFAREIVSFEEDTLVREIGSVKTNTKEIHTPEENTSTRETDFLEENTVTKETSPVEKNALAKEINLYEKNTHTQEINEFEENTYESADVPVDLLGNDVFSDVPKPVPDSENLDTEEPQELTANSLICEENIDGNVINEDLSIGNMHANIEDVHDQVEDTVMEEEMEIDLVTKEEPNIMDFNEFENRMSNSFTISNVFTDIGDTDETYKMETVGNVNEPQSTSKSKKSLMSSVDRSSKKIIKSVVKQARSLTSSEYLWVILQLVPKYASSNMTENKKQIQDIISKRVSDESKKSIDNLLERAKNFTSVEYAALFQKLGDRRDKDKSPMCVSEFSRTIMWFKTHLEFEPEHVVNKSDMHNAYIAHCNNQAMKPLKSTEFMSLLRNIFPQVKERRRDTKGGKCYLYTNIKNRNVLHPPKLPKFAEDQLHNNVLISQYMSCHECCLLYSVVMIQRTHNVGRPKLKIKLGPQFNPETAIALDSPNETSIAVDDPLDLLNITATEKTTEKIKVKIKENIVEIVDLSKTDEHPIIVKKVAKKSVFSKRIKRVPYKYREYIPTPSQVLPSTSKFSGDKPSSTDYSQKLLGIKEKLSRFVITKIENGSKYKVSCTCCQDVFYVPEPQAHDLLSAQEKLLGVFSSPKQLPKCKRNHHLSVKRLYYKYDDIILPETVVYNNIEPAVRVDRFEVYDWFKNEISTLKHKLLESALNALNTNSRRSRYELKAPINSSNIISHTPTQITPQHPPIYISAVRETPKPKETEPPKITEVYIKNESKPSVGRKRHGSREPEVIEISAQKKPKPSYSGPHSTPLNTVYSRNRHMPYNRRKEADFIYFPAIDTSPNNLRLANLGTLYKCILCLMLFNTEQKLADHEKAHLFCHKCRRKLRDVEIMRQHLVKHCQRNFRKRKPLLKIHRVDSIAIMIKKYGETFEISKAYYKELERAKPKKKYREMIRPKVEPIPPLPVIEEVFLNDVKPDLNMLDETTSITNLSNTNIMLEMHLDVKPQPSLVDLSNIPTSTQMPILSIAPNESYFQQERGGLPLLFSEPPQLLPITTPSTKKKNLKHSAAAPSQKPFKIRVKDLMELS